VRRAATRRTASSAIAARPASPRALRQTRRTEIFVRARMPCFRTRSPGQRRLSRRPRRQPLLRHCPEQLGLQPRTRAVHGL